MDAQVLAKSSPPDVPEPPPPVEARSVSAVRSPSRALVAGCSLGSAALLWLCYFPAGLGWLAWVALLPLLCLVRARGLARRIYVGAWVCGLAFFWPALQWMRVADARMYYTWAGLATYCSLYFPLAVFLVRRLDRGTRLPLVVTLPVVWTALEYCRAHLGTGFAWYFLAHTQHAFLPVIQIADVGGAYAVTFLVASVNALVFEALYTWRPLRVRLASPDETRRSWRWSLPLQGAAVLALLGVCLGYGAWRLGQDEQTAGPTVALIQGNLDQRIRILATQPDQDEAENLVLRHYEALSEQAAARQPKPDLIVWPETSFPQEWAELSPDFPENSLAPVWRTAVADLQRRQSLQSVPWRSLMVYFLNKEAIREAKALRSNVLLGLNATVLGPDRTSKRYNSAVLIQQDLWVAGRYDKIHRVPFGEYVPLREWLPWMNRFAPYDFDYSIRVGEHLTRFPLGPYHFGVVICYEDTDPYLARQYVRTGTAEPAADFLVNISNDGWFNGSSEHEEHLAICRFRAVECRRAVARAVNMGISAVIDGNGRVVALPRPGGWADSKKVAAVLTATIPIDHRTSLYAAWGDWLPQACWLALAAALTGCFVRWRLAATKAAANVRPNFA